MHHNRELIKTLNDLIQINRDRVEGYRTAQDDIQDIDIDLHALFGQKIGQSEDFINELSAIVMSHGGEVETDTTVMGKLFRSWMDFKSTLTRENRESVLSSCAYGEKNALEEYDDALSSSTEMPSEIRQTIMEHRDKIQSSLETINRYTEIHESL